MDIEAEAGCIGWRTREGATASGHHATNADPWSGVHVSARSDGLGAGQYWQACTRHTWFQVQCYQLGTLRLSCMIRVACASALPSKREAIKAMQW